MSVSVFDHRDYRKYLEGWLKAQPRKGRGLRSAMAAAVSCQSAYVTRVLQGQADFSPEQAFLLNRFLGHGKEESRYFMLLVQHARAGTQELKADLSEQLEEIARKRRFLKDRIQHERHFSAEEQPIYFSSWHYAALHVALTIPQLRTKEAIARHFGLPVKKVAEILDFLVSIGFADEDRGRYSVGSARMHLAQDSPMVPKHHTNWRMQAIQSLDRGAEEDLHYSSVVTISRDDVPRIRSALIDTIEKLRGTIKESKEEEVHCLLFDFFELQSIGGRG